MNETVFPIAVVYGAVGRVTTSLISDLKGMGITWTTPNPWPAGADG